MNAKTAVTLLALWLTTTTGCASWSYVEERSHGWFDKGDKLYYCRVTAYSVGGDPVPVCVQAVIKPGAALPPPFSYPKPSMQETPQSTEREGQTNDSETSPSQ